jgi:hypothetical protein
MWNGHDHTQKGVKRIVKNGLIKIGESFLLMLLLREIGRISIPFLE